MSHPDDWSEFRHCIRLTREIFGQKAFDGFRGKEISPGSHVQTDDELDAFIRDHAESAYHPCGTCRMATGRRPDRRRRSGVPGHRRRGPGASLADSARSFPRVTNGNLNAPSIVTGEKASDHILGRTAAGAARLSNPGSIRAGRWRTDRALSG
ncbi:GMC oxidoreductase [Mesorhizobium atlanticum]